MSKLLDWAVNYKKRFYAIPASEQETTPAVWREFLSLAEAIFTDAVGQDNSIKSSAENKAGRRARSEAEHLHFKDSNDDK